MEQHPNRSKPRLWRVLLVLAMVAVPAALIGAPGVGAADEHLATYRVTLTNNSPQTFSPPVFVAHPPEVQLFQEGSGASDALRQLAENGDPVPLAELAQNAGAYAVVTAEGGVNPGESVTMEITTPKLNSRISVAAMLVQTNDAFTGINSTWVPGILTGYSMHLYAYDAGTEVNNEMADYVPGLGGTMRDPENNVVRHHTGIQGVGDINPDELGWTGPVAKLSITRAENAENPGPMPVTSKYRVTITNLTQGQTFSPPLITVANRQISLFQEGEMASPGLVALAENGDNSVLGQELDTSGAVWVELLGAGVNPGESVTVEFDAHRLENRISVAMMLVSTNDGFSGVNGAMLPANLATTDVWSYVYDAGSEMNNEMADYVPGLGGTMRDPENGVVSHHMGIAGIGDLDPAVQGWDGPVAHIRVERVSN